MKNNVDQPAVWVDAPKRTQWRHFLLLALVGLPIVMVLSLCAYGFVVWFSQILFFGPPS
ncbi:MAG: hypothetical protein KBC57_03655 [Neisseriaceae bacterium]|nr:hypothetical protein [Neisseriaceae bacterium]MBP6861433.1 hypothetical protein [Neisseriaceae bacterium]